jgi:hypothetical protein
MYTIRNIALEKKNGERKLNLPTIHTFYIHTILQEHDLKYTRYNKSTIHLKIKYVQYGTMHLKRKKKRRNKFTHHTHILIT